MNETRRWLFFSVGRGPLRDPRVPVSIVLCKLDYKVAGLTGCPFPEPLYLHSRKDLHNLLLININDGRNSSGLSSHVLLSSDFSSTFAVYQDHLINWT